MEVAVTTIVDGDGEISVAVHRFWAVAVDRLRDEYLATLAGRHGYDEAGLNRERLAMAGKDWAALYSYLREGFDQASGTTVQIDLLDIDTTPHPSGAS